MELYENEIINAIDNDYVQVIFRPDRSYLKIKWKSSIKNLTTEEAIAITEKVFREIKKFTPKYVMQDNTQLHFNYTREFLQWILTKMTPLLPQLGVKKIVYVEPAETITKIGLEIFNNQAEELTKDQLERNLVRTVAEAEIWLFDDELLDYKPFSEDDKQ